MAKRVNKLIRCKRCGELEKPYSRGMGRRCYLVNLKLAKERKFHKDGVYLDFSIVTNPKEWVEKYV